MNIRFRWIIPSHGTFDIFINILSIISSYFIKTTISIQYSIEIRQFHQSFHHISCHRRFPSDSIKIVGIKWNNQDSIKMLNWEHSSDISDHRTQKTGIYSRYGIKLTKLYLSNLNDRWNWNCLTFYMTYLQYARHWISKYIFCLNAYSSNNPTHFLLYPPQWPLKLKLSYLLYDLSPIRQYDIGFRNIYFV